MKHLLRPFLITLLAVATLGESAWAHSGGLNSEGCHNDRKKGEYHCHRAPAPKQPLFDGGSSPFRNCDAARAAGAAPVYRGDPGYGQHLDRDNDGVGCE